MENLIEDIKAYGVMRDDKEITIFEINKLYKKMLQINKDLYSQLKEEVMFIIAYYYYIITVDDDKIQIYFLLMENDPYLDKLTTEERKIAIKTLVYFNHERKRCYKSNVYSLCLQLAIIPELKILDILYKEITLYNYECLTLDLISRIVEKTQKSFGSDSEKWKCYYVKYHYKNELELLWNELNNLTPKNLFVFIKYRDINEFISKLKP